MKLLDSLKEPPGGWRYLDPDLKTWVASKSFESLVQDVVEIRFNKGLPVDNHIRQMVEDQVCDRLGWDFCDKGVGDAVHAIAKPIAKVLDKTLGTNFSGCGACAKRRARLNT